MSRTKDFVHIKDLLRSINIEYDATVPDRIAHFYPTSKAIVLINSLFNLSHDKAFFITAPYGSGKSLTATYVLHAAENTEKSKPVLSHLAKKVSDVSAPLGRFLIDRVESGNKAIVIALQGYKESLAPAIQKAVEASLDRHGLDADSWQDTAGSNSAADILASLIALSSTLKNKGFDRIILLWDEFGRHIETLVSEGRPSELNDIQQIAEFASRPQTVPMTMGLTLHRNLMDYAGKSPQNIKLEWRKIEGRFKTLQYIDTSKEIYRLISKVVSSFSVDKNVPATIEKKQIAQSIKKIGIFEDFTEEELHELLETTYPIEPCALFHLPYIASKVAQHERTLFTFLNSLNVNDTISVDFLYDYFSEAMSTDTSIGGTYQQWIESQSAISKVDTMDEIRAIKTAAILNIGLSGERRKTNLEYLKCALRGYSEKSSGVEKIISRLIKKKIFLYRKNIDSVSLWHGTDANILARLEEEKSRHQLGFDLVEFLSREIEPVNWKPIEYNNAFHIQRYYRGFYIDRNGLKKELSDLKEAENSFLETGEDARMYYLLPTDEKEKEDMLRDIKKLGEHCQIMWVIPQGSLPIFDTALEVYCYYQLQADAELTKTDPLILPELQQLTDDATEYLQNLVEKSFHPSPTGPTYFLNGTEKKIASVKNFRIFLSEKMKKVFPQTPKLNNEMINRKNPRANLVNARRKLISRIMEGTGKQALGLSGYTPDVSMFRTLLSNTGLYRELNAKWLFADPEEITDTGLREIWGTLKSFFSDASQTQQFNTLFDDLQRPPYGIRKGVLPIFLAAAMRAFPSVITIKDKKGAYPLDIPPSMIDDICNNPTNYIFKVHTLDNAQKKILQGLYELFAPGKNVSIREMDALRKCYDALELWKANLPRNALQTRQLSPIAKSFQEIIARQNDPAKLFFEKFPTVASSTDPRAILSTIGKIKTELENVVEAYFTQAALAIKHSIHIDDMDADVCEAINAWADYFPDSAISTLLDQSRRAFLSKTKQKFASEQHLIDSLAIMLIGLPVKNWDDSNVSDFNRKIQEYVTTSEDILLHLSEELDKASARKAVQKLAVARIKQLYSKIQQTTNESDARALMTQIIGGK